MNDIKFMKEALKEAKKAYLLNEVPIGAVLVKDNKIIARAHNLKEKNNDATAHAEILVIQKASKKLKNWRLLNTTLYVTLEPCVMCASAISQSRISRVVYALDDEKNGAIKNTIKLYKNNGVNPNPEFKGGVLEKEAKDLIQKFFKLKRLKKLKK